jgi:hypothetical protein
MTSCIRIQSDRNPVHRDNAGSSQHRSLWGGCLIDVLSHRLQQHAMLHLCLPRSIPPHRQSSTWSPPADPAARLHVGTTSRSMTCSSSLCHRQESHGQVLRPYTLGLLSQIRTASRELPVFGATWNPPIRLPRLVGCRSSRATMRPSHKAGAESGPRLGRSIITCEYRDPGSSSALPPAFVADLEPMLLQALAGIRRRPPSWSWLRYF